jgi:hypothetical protein
MEEALEALSFLGFEEPLSARLMVGLENYAWMSGWGVGQDYLTREEAFALLGFLVTILDSKVSKGGVDIPGSQIYSIINPLNPGVFGPIIAAIQAKNVAAYGWLSLAKVDLTSLIP